MREEYARWLEWLNGSVDLARGVPVWWREVETPLFRGTAIWLACGVASWFALAFLSRVPALGRRGRYCTAAAMVLAVAGMLGLSITWTAERTDGRAPTPAQLTLLRHLSSEPRTLAVQLTPPRRLSAAEIPAMLRLEPAFAVSNGGAGRNDRPLFAIPAIPAGEYRLRFILRATEGLLMLGIGRDQFALRTEEVAAMTSGVVMNFPVDVRAIMVRGDEDARRNVRGLTIEPLRIVPPSARLADGYARRAVRYDAASVYFLDERSFPDPEGFWLGGARDASVVVQPDAPQATVPLLLRNGAVQNVVTVESGAWKESFTLAAGEERRVEVPFDRSRGAARITFTTSAGFRPSEVDANSRDDRFLGTWVSVN